MRSINRYEELLSAIEDSEQDYNKFYENENREAGIRLRRSMQRIRKIANDIRRDVQEIKATFEPKILRSKKNKQ